MTDDTQHRGIVSRPGRSGAFTGNAEADARRIIHGYAVDLDKAQETIRERDRQLQYVAESLDTVKKVLTRDTISAQEANGVASAMIGGLMLKLGGAPCTSDSE